MGGNRRKAERRKEFRIRKKGGDLGGKGPECMRSRSCMKGSDKRPKKKEARTKQVGVGKRRE